jgi:hypothetical protein
MAIRQIKKNCEKQRNFNNFNNLIYRTSSNPPPPPPPPMLMALRRPWTLITETWLNDNISDSIAHIYKRL